MAMVGLSLSLTLDKTRKATDTVSCNGVFRTGTNDLGGVCT